MDRDIPVFNRPVMEKIYRKNQEKHLERLRNIKVLFYLYTEWKYKSYNAHRP